MSKTDRESTCSEMKQDSSFMGMKGSELAHKAKEMVNQHREKIEEVSFYVLRTGFRVLMLAFVIHIINKLFYVFVNSDGRTTSFRSSFGLALMIQVMAEMVNFFNRV